ncbi:transcriptional regulator with XRE-family HTH domain [Amycolatopsis lexingtonensis]|uniref:Transcriptional regulator with XRE-family HTH domain n=1 Tax=Amycolatopsis lexingtonensis TaxID=218822 RepID=A0ABR9HZI4_9PSEU|nr:helix-turn-helix transcriptional regulator [Amycolatopsis lexingtonensis]MBE1496325.1 transcriptional regulator with XRE-family HTH domain [Amycolatopsis lexingtonensis]
MATSDTDTGDLARATGAELKSHREQHGWSRRSLAIWSGRDCPVSTLASWEQGTRSMSLRQLDRAGHLYDIAPSELLRRAEHRISWAPGIPVDLDALAAVEVRSLIPAARWARYQIQAGGDSVRRLSVAEIASLAAQCGIATAELTLLLAPDAAVRP